MSDEPKARDPRVLWRNQPEEKFEMNLHHFLDRRTRELHSSTRAEIITSVAAALFFVAVLAWRVSLAQDTLSRFGFAIVMAWVLSSLYWFRARIWGHSPPMDHVSAPGLEYYRNELEQRRDHLRNIWLWHGPLFLACLIFVVSFLGRAFPNTGRLLNVLPLVILLAIWTGFGFLRRRRQANQIQQEIDELKSLDPRQ